MGLNISLVKLGKKTKLVKDPDYKYKYIDFNEDENECIKLEKDELYFSTERTLSYMILDNLVGKYSYYSNDNWYIKLDNIVLDEKWKKLKIDPGSVWLFNDLSPEMQKIFDDIDKNSDNFYNFASALKRHKIDIGGF